MSAAVERYQPSERDFALMERQAKVIAQADFAGKLKGKAADIAMIGMTCMALDIPFANNFGEIHVIDTKSGPTQIISARLRVGLARRAGHRVWFEHSDDQSATCCLQRAGETEVHRLTYTIDQARKAGLITKDNWSKHPADMLRAAAARKLVNMAAQDVLLGLPAYVATGAELDRLDEEHDLDVPDVGDDYTPVEAEIIPHPTLEPPIVVTDDERRQLRDLIRDLQPHQRTWLLARRDAAGLPKIDDPAFRPEHAEMLREFIESAGDVEADDPGRPFD